MMAGSLVLLPAVLSFCLSVSESSPPTPQIGTETSYGDEHNRHLILELDDAKLKISRLESIFEETLQQINVKSLYLEGSEKIIEDMARKMDRLHSVLSSLKGESSRANERLNQMEEEVRLLWATVRKTNFELHFLESKAQDAESNMKLVTSRVEVMSAIVTEQWIQIQQLEQALHNAEAMALKATRQVISRRCTFLKMLRRILDSSLFHKQSALGSHVSQVLQWLETMLSAAKKYHHELQGFIKQEMEKNKFTAAFANREVVFFVASALFTFPMMSGCMLLSSQFS